MHRQLTLGAVVVFAGLGVHACDKREASPSAPSASALPATVALPAADAGATDAGIDEKVPPTPKILCDHLFELAVASEGASGAMLALGSPDECVAHEKRENAQRSTSSCRLGVCSMRATTWSEAKRCLRQSAAEQDPADVCAHHSSR